MDLYKEEELETGEVSLCSLGAIVESNIIDDDDYLRACYVALKIVDFCIDNADYVLPHIGYTAKRRRNAAIGIVGPAYTLAKKGIRYSSPEGLIEHHRIAERHAYFVIKASLQLGKERGNAEWIHKTKWPQGWTPAKTYKRTVDELVDPSYCVYDWDELSEEIIANKGIRNSSVIAEMPTESSSKATGLPNSYYPVRALVLTKSDLNNTIEWVAKDNDIFGDQYELAYTIPPKNMVNVHAVYQKWTDMSLSADEYHDRSVNPWLSQVELVDLRLYAHKYGVKAKYYSNSLTSNQDYDKVVDGNNDCGGGCTI
jgi:ribonucleoside-diphosphate reductase alpha chain